MSTPLSGWERAARVLKLWQPVPTPQWLKLAMLAIACALLALTPLVVFLGGEISSFHLGGSLLGFSFLLLLAANRLRRPRGTAAALMRLAGIVLMVSGATIYLASALFDGATMVKL